MDSYQIIKRPLHTEKSVTDIGAANTYHFEVDPGANKNQIRQALQDIFANVKVQSVRTLWVRGKTRRRGLTVGRTRTWKKAVVKLRQGDTIDIGY